MVGAHACEATLRWQKVLFLAPYALQTLTGLASQCQARVSCKAPRRHTA